MGTNDSDYEIETTSPILKGVRLRNAVKDLMKNQYFKRLTGKDLFSKKHIHFVEDELVKLSDVAIGELAVIIKSYNSYNTFTIPECRSFFKDKWKPLCHLMDAAIEEIRLSESDVVSKYLENNADC